jgi:hypothetical protein
MNSSASPPARLFLSHACDAGALYKIQSAAQDLRGLRPSFRVAQEVGARLGYGENLFRTLQGRPAPENAWVLSAR